MPNVTCIAIAKRRGPHRTRCIHSSHVAATPGKTLRRTRTVIVRSHCGRPGEPS
jgi:hypothetical protein